MRSLLSYLHQVARTERYDWLYRRAVAFERARHLSGEQGERVEVLAEPREIGPAEKHLPAGLPVRGVTLKTWPAIAVTRRREVLAHPCGLLTDRDGRLFTEHARFSDRASAWRRQRAALGASSGPGVEPTVDRAFWADSFYCDNYYHWLLEVVARLILAGATIREARLPVVVATRRAYQIESLRWFFPELEFVAWRGDRPLRIRECWSVPPIEQGCVPDPRMVAALRQETRGRRAARATGAAVWIQRAERMRPLWVPSGDFSARVERLGFTIVRPEALGFGQQLEMFSHARAIASVHGAGLANALWMPAGGRVVEVASALHAQGCYALLAAQLGQRHDLLLVDRGWGWLGSRRYGVSMPVRLSRRQEAEWLEMLAAAAATAATAD